MLSGMRAAMLGQSCWEKQGLSLASVSLRMEVELKLK